MRTCKQAEAVFNGSQLIFNWLSDFSTEFLNVTLVDGPRFGRFGRFGVRFCNEVLAQFTDESVNFKTFFRGDLGDILFPRFCVPTKASGEPESVRLG